MEGQKLARRPLMAMTGLLLAGAVTGATAHPTTFYVSASGDDTADGLSKDTAWASIDKVNSHLPSGSVALFRRGDTFYGELEPPANSWLGAFGSGSKPVISMYKLLNRPDGWIQHSANIWKIGLASTNSHGGYSFTGDADIGHLVVDGKIKAGKKKKFAELAYTWDFWSENRSQILYVAAHENPTKLARSIRAAPRGRSGAAIRCNHDSINVRDLHVTGSGGHGITGTGANVVVSHCVIDSIGGSFLRNFKDGMVRYGNGIENWIGAKRWTIEENKIAQVYDAAYTCQGRLGSGAQGWEDMTIRNNHIRDCTQSFEFWSTGNDPNAGFKRVLVDGNICERAGYSAFADFRPNQHVRVHLLTYEWELPADITVQNNFFDGAYGAYSYHLVEPVGLVTRNNEVALRSGMKIQHQRDEKIEQATLWQAETGLETGSTMYAQ